MAEASAKTSSNDKRTNELPLIATKLYIPPVQPGRVPRPRLIQRLNEGLTRKLILITAHAGFGKTTLLSEWRTTAPTKEMPFAWVSLDEEDNNPARFWAYAVAALQRLHPEVGVAALAGFRSPQLPPAEEVLPILINELAALPHDFILALDDYHVITTEAIHKGLAFLVEQMPPQLHLVIASRTEPSLPLSLLRGRGQLLELRPDDLRFRHEEMTEFLNQVMGLSLTPGQVKMLEQRTEGWIASLQMAAISLQGRPDADAFIRAFSGSHRHVVDYLVEQVLERQPADLQNFLQQTSILDRMCSSLCDAVTEQGGGQATLEQLERANLFLVPLDDERKWYRYHHLFADALRDRSRHSQPARISHLHRRAAQWFDRQGQIEEALHHALAAPDHPLAGRIVESIRPRTGLAFIDRWQVWLRRLPAEVLRSRVNLCIALGNTLFRGRSEQMAEAEAWLDQAEQLLHMEDVNHPRFTDDLQWSWGALYGARLAMAGTQEDKGHIRELAHLALDRYPGDTTWRHLIHALMGPAYSMCMEYAIAEQYLAVSVPHLRSQPRFQGLFSDIHWSYVQWVRGELRRSAQSHESVLHRASLAAGRGPTPVDTRVHMFLGVIHYEWNDLTAAESHYQQALTSARYWNSTYDQLYAFTGLARVYLAQENVEQSTSVEQQARELAPRIPQGDAAILGNVRGMLAWLALLRLRQGDVQAAMHWVREAALDLAKLDYFHANEYYVLARLWLVQGQAAKAKTLLERLWQRARVQEWDRVEILTLLALAHQAVGQTRQAVVVVAEALALAEPEGYIRTFVDEGEPMADLLREAYRQGIAPHYIPHVLAAFPETMGHRVATAPLLIDPLSERELAVLALLAQGLSNRQIAERLIIALSTVKDHLIHIYRKLDVHNRTEAVARAHALNLLLS